MDLDPVDLDRRGRGSGDAGVTQASAACVMASGLLLAVIDRTAVHSLPPSEDILAEAGLSPLDPWLRPGPGRSHGSIGCRPG